MLRKGMFLADRYEIIKQIGTGGMSDVYKAKCHKLNRYVAIKVMKSEFSEDKTFVSKFRAEAQSVAGLMFNLSYIHSYIEDILEICSESDYNYPLIFTDKKSQYAINMCFVQIGEHCAQIRDIDRTFFDNQELRLYEIKGMRDRIVHSYGKIDYNIIKESISKDIPKLKEKIEEIVDEDILDNPYLLYETEYDDYIEEKNEEPEEDLEWRPRL